MNRPDAETFLIITKIGMVLYTGAAILVGHIMRGPHAMYAIALGGCIMYVNLLIVIWIVERIIGTGAEKKRYPLLSALKTLALMGAIAGLIYYQKEMGLYTLIGLLNIFFGVALAGIIYTVREFRVRDFYSRQ